MTYAKHRGQIRSGQILAWGHDAFRTWHDVEIQAVRAFTRSEYAHVGCAWTVGGRVLVIEAVVPLVRIFPLSRLLPAYWLQAKVDWTGDMEERALSKVGEPYSKWEAVKSFFGKVIPGADDRWQCAEIASYIRGDAANPTPSSLVASAMKNGATLRYLD